MKYTVELEKVSLEQAVHLIDQNNTIFYTYAIGKPIWILDKESIFSAIKGKAIFLTPCSFLNANDSTDGI